MGTNFLWYKTPVEYNGTIHLFAIPPDRKIDMMDPTFHIGKRSAAGLYCWDCMVTLCRDGNTGLHRHCGHDLGCRCRWFDKCPKCGGEQIKDSSNAVMIELGFHKPKIGKTCGVSTASSFSWAQKPEFVRKVCTAYPRVGIIADEYRNLFTGKAFLDMLEANCPIEFMHFIGKEFC